MRSIVTDRSRCRLGCENHVLNGSSDHHGKGQFLGKASPTVKYRDFLPRAVQKRLNRSICRLGSGLRWAEGSRSSIVFARWRQCTWRHCCVLCKTAEPIDLPFGLWTRVGRRKHKFNHIRQVAPMCPDGRAHWRQLANTIEPSVCGGDAVLCQNYFDHLLLLLQLRSSTRLAPTVLATRGCHQSPCLRPFLSHARPGRRLWRR